MIKASTNRLALLAPLLSLLAPIVVAEEYSTVASTELPSTIRVLQTGTNTIVTVDFKDYVKHVLPNEWFPSWDSEALQAGALAVKTYGWFRLLNPKYPGKGYDVRDDTADQVYIPSSSTPSSTDEAVEDTWNTKLTQGGSIFAAQYDSGAAGSPDPLYPGRLSQYGTDYWARGEKTHETILHYYYGNIDDVLTKSLDLIFAIDTTGSMWDDIDAVKGAASQIVTSVHAAVPYYRVAVVDYKDFPVYPYGDPGDYPYKADSRFSQIRSVSSAALQGLAVGGGADTPEAVYSALVSAIRTEGLGAWRECQRLRPTSECGTRTFKKRIIAMGDAPPHDPEPFTGYTLATVTAEAEAADPVSVYSIAIGFDPTAQDAFGAIAEGTGGKLFLAPTADDVVSAILEATAPEPENRPPNCSFAVANPAEIWPPNHKMIAVSIQGVEDPDGDPVSLTVTSITQDEPVLGIGSGDIAPDGFGVLKGAASVRAERSGKGNGRVYRISFAASDGLGGECTGSVFTAVPHDQGANNIPVDDGQNYDSTVVP